MCDMFPMEIRENQKCTQLHQCSDLSVPFGFEGILVSDCRSWLFCWTAVAVKGTIQCWRTHER